MTLRVATWNVFHGTILSTQSTPQQRMTNFAVHCWGLDVDVVAFQEVPQAIVTGNLAATVAGTRYVAQAIPTEYPPRGNNINLPAPYATTSDGYVFLFHPDTVSVVNTMLGFINPAAFLEGTSQGRPPVGGYISNVAGTHSIQFLSWHNEAGSAAVTGVMQLATAYSRIRSGTIIVGDFNVPALVGLANPLFRGWTAVCDNLDAILATSDVQDVRLQVPFLSDFHYAIVADVGENW